MKIGKVTDSVLVTKQADFLSGQTFLMVETGSEQLVAADQVGAGTGDTVLLAMGATAARYSLGAPIDAAVVAILDQKGFGD